MQHLDYKVLHSFVSRWKDIDAKEDVQDTATGAKISGNFQNRTPPKAGGVEEGDKNWQGPDLCFCI